MEILETPGTLPRYRSPLNSHLFPKYFEPVSPISETIPDQSLSIKEILDRYSRGLGINGEQFAVYHGEEDEMPVLQKMDLSEIQELQEDLAEYTRIKREEFEQEKKEQEEQQRKRKEQSYIDFEEWRTKTKQKADGKPAKADSTTGDD